MQSFSDQIAAQFSDVELQREQMHDYQNMAVDFMRKNPFSALFVDLGLGKSVTSLTLIIDLVCDMEINNTLVIAPVRVANDTWPTEIRIWQHAAAMTISHIRDDIVVNAVNQAGRDARALLKRWGPTHPDVVNFIRRSRELALRRRAKSALGLTGANITRYGRNHIDEAMLKPASPDEIKLFSKYARQQAAKVAVRSFMRDNPSTVWVINREQLEFLVDAFGSDWPFDCVIIDESSSLKNHKTARWKALRKVRPLIRRMHQLTATPAAEGYLHLWPQISLLDMGERLGKTFKDFTDTYFTHNKYNFTYTMKKDADTQIAEKISDICLTMKAEDYLDMKEPVRLTHHVALDSKARTFYDTMERDSVVELEGREVEAETAAALSCKLLQIASGVLYETFHLEDTDTGDEERADSIKVKQVHHIHDHKIDALRDLADEHEGESLLVVYHFKSSLVRLQKAFPKAVQMDKAGKVIKPWNAGKVPMLLVHPASAGHGLNLQKGGRHVVFFDLPWSLELYLQTCGRLHRQGQKFVVFLHHLVSKNTLDEVVLRCLLEKRDAQEELFTLLKQMRRNHNKAAAKQQKVVERAVA